MTKMPDHWDRSTKTDNVDSTTAVAVGISNLALLIVCALLFYFLTYLIRIYSEAIVVLISRPQEGLARIPMAIAIATICLVVGKMLHLLKRRRRRVYGALEIFAAVLLAIEICIRPSDTWSSAAVMSTIIGVLYVVVSGFENISPQR